MCLSSKFGKEAINSASDLLLPQGYMSPVEFPGTLVTPPSTTRESLEGEVVGGPILAGPPG